MNNTLITQDRLDSLINLASQTPRDSNIAEVGVYKGGSLKFMGINYPDKLVFGFDTFTGLPAEQHNADEVHQIGDFNDTSVEAVKAFLDEDINNYVLVKGLFPDSTVDLGQDLLKVGFVHCDTDFYEGVVATINFFWDKLPKGGIIAFDDYKWPNCPGVEKALVEFGQPILQDVPYQAYIVKN